MSATVLLGDVVVGRLTSAGDGAAFSFDAEYLSRANRPVLSQSFEDLDLSPARPFMGVPLPVFFRNALPEGALRRVVSARLSGASHLELEMLYHLGRDLPGALRVLIDIEDGETATPDDRNRPRPRRPRDPNDPLRFSLSGVQLKASVLAEEDRVTLPLVGQSGDWIAKFPSTTFRSLPENEITVLRWARAAGLDVPDHRLVDVASIQGLPEEFPREGRALLVRRFDRHGSTGRVHQEDFAQVFEVEPEDKDIPNVPVHVTYAGIGAVVSALAGEGDFLELVRRLAFVVLSGNADAHAKNWSLVYPDAINPRLSPLYDVVATIAYPSLPRNLALGLTLPEDPYYTPPVPIVSVREDHFRDVAIQAGASPDLVVGEVRRFIERARDAWASLREEAPSFVRRAVDKHLDEISLKAGPLAAPH